MTTKQFNLMVITSVAISLGIISSKVSFLPLVIIAVVLGVAGQLLCRYASKYWLK
ncbi:hypothetical protein QWY77_07675 [Thalassotalea ponticola]|uniref:hypothetical protein n=1 Tax=Thalassotalea ponticola TaxID=1523392 RepID=UPI0025B4D5F2|nr:hypothetical protein [Thalassotalea ponticola]MDN3652640.1 hypothetical protein [Thalassotalea ponticola]